MNDIPYMWDVKRNDKNELTYETERDSETQRMNLQLWGIRMGEQIVRESGKAVYTLLYLRWITNKDLLYTTWNSAQCHVAAWMGAGFGGEWIYIYV